MESTDDDYDKEDYLLHSFSEIDDFEEDFSEDVDDFELESLFLLLSELNEEEDDSLLLLSGETVLLFVYDFTDFFDFLLLSLVGLELFFTFG